MSTSRVGDLRLRPVRWETRNATTPSRIPDSSAPCASELFGIDVLASDGHAAVVDVNAFPVFRGVPGGAGKLASYVERAAARTVTGMTLPATSPITSIDELPGLVPGIIERAGAPAPGR